MEENDKQLLSQQEALISRNVLKVIDPKSWSNLPFRDKQNEFKNTCYAIQSIVNTKSYRPISPSLELYFKKKWSVSRAQVYRLYESASVLKMLEEGGCAVLPFKERQCRQIRNCVGLDKEEMIKLWNQVLALTNANESKISHMNMEDWWSETMDRELVKKPAPHQIAKRIIRIRSRAVSKDVNSDTDYSDNTEPPSCTSTNNKKKTSAHTSELASPPLPACALPATSAQTDQAKHSLRAAKPKSHSVPIILDANPSDFSNTLPRDEIGHNVVDLSQYTGLERDWLECQQAMQNLAAHGYVIESLVDGQWVRPTLWKLNTVLDLDHLKEQQAQEKIDQAMEPSTSVSPNPRNNSSGLDNLLMAAESLR